MSWSDWVKRMESASSPSKRGEAADSKQAAPAQRRDAVVRRVIIGLDYGTSSSKCIIQVRDGQDREGKFWVVSNPAHGGSFGPFLWPTSAVRVGDRVLLGHAAERSGLQTVVRSFKMCLLCEANPHRTDAICPRCGCGSPGRFNFGAGCELLASELAVLSMASLIRQAMNQTRRAVPDGATIKWQLNVAAPLDQMDQGSLHRRLMERCVNEAWLLARDRFPQDSEARDLTIAEVRELLAWAHAQPDPDAGESTTLVIPETHAAMTGHILAPDTPSGLYATIDIGAGTTDVAVFWLGKRVGQMPEAYYYAAGTHPIGLDEVDRALQPHLNAQDGNLRRAREQMDGDSCARLLPTFAPVLNAIYKHYLSVFNAAWQKDPRTDRTWFELDSSGARNARFTLFLIGGGGQFDPTNERMCAREFFVPCDGWCNGPWLAEVPVNLHILGPKGADRTTASRDELDRVSCLLPIAYGLSQRAIDIPQWRFQREALHYEVTYRERTHHEELYDKR